MHWHQIRQQYPNRWLLIEATAAHTVGDERMLDEIVVVDEFVDSVMAFQRYRELHRAAPQREWYVVHTDRETLTITDRVWLGIRTGS